DDVCVGVRVVIRRANAERCLYGVDLNPMAVQLARLSLWLATLAADRPLSFLDHRLQAGDSLVGAWVSTLRQAPGDARTTRRAGAPMLFDDDAIGDALRAALPMRFSIESTPNDSLEQVRAKERALAAGGCAVVAVEAHRQPVVRVVVPDEGRGAAAFGVRCAVGFPADRSL